MLARSCRASNQESSWSINAVGERHRSERSGCLTISAIAYGRLFYYGTYLPFIAPMLASSRPSKSAAPCCTYYCSMRTNSASTSHQSPVMMHPSLLLCNTQHRKADHSKSAISLFLTSCAMSTTARSSSNLGATATTASKKSNTRFEASSPPNAAVPPARRLSLHHLPAT